MDLFGVAKILEKTGELQRSALFIRRALEGSLPEDIALLAKKKLASHFKKTQDWEKAIGLWREMTLRDQLSSFRELAMYYEHKAKDYETAKAFAEEGLALAMQLSRTFESDFSHRLERLRAKISRPRKDGAAG
jgi:lipopolysaccharide biosynthesis regulator YciM